MQLTDHDWKQLNEDYWASPGHLLHLSRKMLGDLREARDRLKQTAQNSSRPSGSYVPWEQAVNGEKERQVDDRIDAAAEPTEEAGVKARSKRRSSEGSLAADLPVLTNAFVPVPHLLKKPDNWRANCSMIGKRFGVCWNTRPSPSPTMWRSKPCAIG